MRKFETMSDLRVLNLLKRVLTEDEEKMREQMKSASDRGDRDMATQYEVDCMNLHTNLVEVESRLARLMKKF